MKQVGLYYNGVALFFKENTACYYDNLVHASLLHAALVWLTRNYHKIQPETAAIYNAIMTGIFNKDFHHT